MRSKGPTPRVTLAKVAQNAGVSITTVSVVLSGREESLKQFHPDTIAKVRQTAERLGYCANLFASGLPAHAPPFFAMVIRWVGGEKVNDWHLWGFDGDLLAGVIRAAAEAGVYPIVGRCGPGGGMEEASLPPIQRLIAGGPFGAIVRSPSAPLEKFLRTRLSYGQPIVVVFPDPLLRWPSNAIDVDNAAIGETAAALLASQGRKKWVLVRLTKRLSFQMLRCEGFLKAARKHGADVETLAIPPRIVTDHLMTRDFLARRLRRLRFDGIFAVESVASIGSLLAGLHMGQNVGDDFNLVGCDCAPWQSTPLPRITSVDVSWRHVGKVALRTLVQLARDRECRFDTILVKPHVTAADTCPAPGVLQGTRTK